MPPKRKAKDPPPNASPPPISKKRKTSHSETPTTALQNNDTSDLTSRSQEGTDEANPHEPITNLITTRFQIPFNDKSITCEHRAPDTKLPSTSLSPSSTTSKAKAKAKPNRTNLNPHPNPNSHPNTKPQFSPDPPPKLIFTHGASGTLSSPATANFTTGFGSDSPLISFQGPMNLVSRTRMFRTVYDHVAIPGLAVGGRSMGARAAVGLAVEQPDIKALVLVSYPLVGPRGDVRDEGLKGLAEGVDVLFIIGARDRMCGIEEFGRVRGEMRAGSWVVVVEGADHGMNVKDKDGVEVLGRWMGRVAAEWLRSRDRAKRYCHVGWDDAMGRVMGGEWGA